MEKSHASQTQFWRRDPFAVWCRAIDRRIRNRASHVRPAIQPTAAIKHVVHIQFDNVHLRRDNPNVPSDLEQMPNLLNFMQQQRSGQRQSPHSADLAHRDRHPHRADRRLWRPHGRSGGEQLRLLSQRRLGRLLQLVPLLDRARRRRQAGAGQRERQDLPGAVGAVHPGRLRCRRVLDRQHGIREPAGRRAHGIRHRLARGRGGLRRAGAAAHARERACAPGAQHRLSRHRGPLRGGQPALQQQPCPHRSAAGRAGRLCRLQGALRQRERRAGDLRGGARRLRRRRQRQGHRRQRHRRRLWPPRLPQHLQPDRHAVARLRRHHARGGHAGRLPLCRRCA